MVRLALYILVVASAALTIAHGALAHDATWIGRKALHNNRGLLCCGPSDCGHLIAGNVELRPDGWHVDGMFQVDAWGESPDSTFEVHTVFPEMETLPSQDEETWACKMPTEDKPRCLFIHPPGV
jgi:hypothetical protein